MEVGGDGIFVHGLILEDLDSGALDDAVKIKVAVGVPQHIRLRCQVYDISILLLELESHDSVERNTGLTGLLVDLDDLPNRSVVVLRLQGQLVD